MKNFISEIVNIYTVNDKPGQTQGDLGWYNFLVSTHGHTGSLDYRPPTGFPCSDYTPSGYNNCSTGNCDHESVWSETVKQMIMDW